MSAVGSTVQQASFDAEKVRQDFPILDQEVKGNPLIYLDNGATSQKPRAVIDTLTHYYEHSNANVHRGVHELSERATRDMEAAREKVRAFLNAKDAHEIVFVRGTTEAINLVAQSYGCRNIGKGDEVLITEMEHHSNIVPWKILCDRLGATLKVVPINDAGELLLDEYRKMLGPRTRMLAVTHVSNALGTINPVKEMIGLAHEHGVPVLIDGAQAVPHVNVDVQDLDCDFYAFSGHKVYGPTGIGALYGKLDLLKAMDPYQSGGEMIRRVTFDEIMYAEPPTKFEAGTPDIAGIIGLGAALDYLDSFDIESIAAHEHELLAQATAAISGISGVRLLGTARAKASLVSFVLEGAHAHDIGTIMDNEGVAVRAGHHCAMPVMTRYGVAASVRASFAMYNTTHDVDALVRGINKVKEVMRL